MYTKIYPYVNVEFLLFHAIVIIINNRDNYVIRSIQQVYTSID